MWWILFNLGCAPAEVGGTPSAEVGGAGERLRAVRAGQSWVPDDGYQRRMSGEVLDASHALGCEHLRRNQLEGGNFRYSFDYVTGESAPDDNQVRQAGALWGLSLCHRTRGGAGEEVRRGLRGFGEASSPGPQGQLHLHYKGNPVVSTGATALTALATIELLRAEPDAEDAGELRLLLDGWLAFLVAMQREDGSFSAGLDAQGVRRDKTSSYYDGEALLALTVAARHLEREALWPVVERSSAALVVRYTLDAWEVDEDSDRTKGFYQWGSMAFAESVEAGHDPDGSLRDGTLALAWWMIHTHRTLERSRNTGYAVEGMVRAWDLATLSGESAAAAVIADTVDKTLSKLTTWQVEGPLLASNTWLLMHRTQDPTAIGGVLNQGRGDTTLRIDVTQHQMHAVALARRSLYPD